MKKYVMVALIALVCMHSLGIKAQVRVSASNTRRYEQFVSDLKSENSIIVSDIDEKALTIIEVVATLLLKAFGIIVGVCTVGTHFCGAK